MISRAPSNASAAVRSRGRDRHRGLRQRHRADPVLGRRGAQPVALDRRLHDLTQLTLGHRHVGLVVQVRDLTGDAGERHDRSRPRVADPLGQRIERQRLVGDPHVRGGRLGRGTT